jgi:hypothetical protein
MLCELGWNKKKKLTARMHGVESFKVINAQQGKLINNYRNTQYKLLKTGTTQYAETVN